MQKENRIGEEHNELLMDTLGGRFSLSTPQQSYATVLRQGKQHKQPQTTQSSSICHKRNFREEVCQYRLLFRLIMTL
jgi:hypothetical protein